MTEFKFLTNSNKTTERVSWNRVGSPLWALLGFGGTEWMCSEPLLFPRWLSEDVSF